MAATRSVQERVDDALIAYRIFREELTDQAKYDLFEKMTGSDARAQVAAMGGDPNAYAVIVQAALGLSRLIAENDRAALQAAVLATQSGITPRLSGET